MDTSSEIIHGILPVFLVTGLGASFTTVGIIEGVSEAATLIVKVFSGPVSDWMGKRKPLVVIGYSMGALSKPAFAVAQSVGVVVAARVFDRIGKGIRGAPRDALVADLAPAALRGRAFGLRQSLDTVGAFLGPFIAIVLMKVTQDDFRFVFWIAVIPALFSVATLVFGVEESSAHTQPPAKRIRYSDIKSFHSSFWIVVFAGAIFQLARFSEAFLILRAKDLGLGIALAPIVLIVLNIVYSLSAYPIGHLSDRVARVWFLVAGLAVLVLSELVLAMSQSVSSVLFGVALWGLHLGMTQGTLAALVADTCLPQFRGTAYGLFNLFSAVALLAASLVAGILWDSFGSRATFLTGAAFAFLSCLLFLAVPRNQLIDNS